MSAPGRPTREYRSAQHEGSPVSAPGGVQAVTLKVAEQYVAAFAGLAKAGNTLIVPPTARISLDSSRRR